jgi:ribonuclease HII
VNEAVDRWLWEVRLQAAGFRRVAGVDEAGRGPLAGPVVAAAVSFPAAWIGCDLPPELLGLNDSKLVRATRRARWYEVLTNSPEIHWAVAVVEAEDIDRWNILRATHQGMRRALADLLQGAPEHVLVDGLPVPELGWPQTALVGGDGLSYSIAAASILAKVTRDRLMEEHDRRWPMYGFARHKGYPTADHRQALDVHGPCPIHRRTFAPVARQPQFPGWVP